MQLASKESTLTFRLNVKFFMEIYGMEVLRSSMKLLPEMDIYSMLNHYSNGLLHYPLEAHQ